MISKINIEQSTPQLITLSSENAIIIEKGMDTNTEEKAYFDRVWNDLLTLLNMLYKRGLEVEISYQELYEDIRIIGIYNLEEKLYLNLLDYYKIFISEELNKIKEITEKSNILMCIEDIWMKLSNNMNLITQILIWFERGYLLRKKLKTKTIERLILSILEEYMNQNEDLKKLIIHQVLQLIHQDRDNLTVNKLLLRNIITMLIKIDIYTDRFEPEFFRMSESYYRNEADNMVINFEITKYLNNTQKRINEEINRIEEYMNKATKNKLIALLEKLFITDKLQTILSQGFDILMNNYRYDNLAQLYYFLNKVGKIDFLKKTWAYHIKTKGTSLINQEEVNVENILEFKNVLDKVVEECFLNNPILKNSQQYAFEDFINLKTNKIAELTSKFIDEKLKKAHKLHMSEEELEKKLEEVLSLFRFLSAKDVFEAFYTKRLVKRLLLGNISSFELENKMIERFKAECGPTYTKKAEDIFKEFEISKTLNAEFLSSEYFPKMQNPLEFFGNIFSTNSWPLKSAPIAKFPFPLNEYVIGFTAFYTKKYPGALLFWQYETSICELNAYLSNNQKYVITMSVIQAFILLLFNIYTTITFQEMQQMIGIDPEKLKGELISLAFDKEKLLIKNTEGKKILDNDQFSLNQAYASKAKKVKINSLQKKETTEEVEQTTNRVLQERQYLLDASIVRIMKSKKTLLHNDLINEVFNDLKLPILVSFFFF